MLFCDLFGRCLWRCCCIVGGIGYLCGGVGCGGDGVSIGSVWWYWFCCFWCILCNFVNGVNDFFLFCLVWFVVGIDFGDYLVLLDW